MEINRLQPPKIAALSPPPLARFEKITLSNGIPLFIIPYGNQPVAELQVVLHLGHCYENLPGLASFTSQLTREGVKGKSALEIEEALDWHGASLGIESGYEITTFTLSVPSKSLMPMIKLLFEVLFSPTFPEAEYRLHKARLLQTLQVQEQKTSWQARRLFNQYMFGSAHPYGVTVTKNEIENITLEAVKNYHNQYFQPGNCMLFLAGQYELQPILELLEQSFGKNPLIVPEPAPMELTSQVGLRVYEMPENLQSTLCLGHLAFERNHPDYHKMRFVTTILGGYFGSLLMKNIREAKGYTYGIYASWACRKRAGFLIISADVANAYVAPTLEETRREIQKMQNELLSEEELMVAKNYTLGRYIDSQETPFQVADIIKNIILNQLPLEDMQNGFEQIQAMQAQEVMELSQRYFLPEKMLTVIAGNYPQL
jgi:zinc protease